ncbi:MAG: iron dependent repressor, metal binding and dimerization domain protein [Bdellovibrionota bacterium]
MMRSHRLWEAYLEKYVGLSSSHVHKTAEELEHFTDRSLVEKKLAEETEK